MPRYSENARKQAMEEVRQRLMEAAMEEIAQKGYESANVNTISLAAGFAKGTIYNYFPSKKDLMLAILEQAGTAHFDFMAAQVRAENDPALRVNRFFEAGFAFVKDNPARGQVLVSTVYGTQAEFKDHLYQIYQPMFELVAREILAPGMSQGIFRQVDPVGTAVMVMTFYLGTASNVDASGTPWLNPGNVAEFVLHALRSSP